MGRAPLPAAFDVSQLNRERQSEFVDKVNIKGGGRGRPPYTWKRKNGRTDLLPF